MEYVFQPTDLFTISCSWDLRARHLFKWHDWSRNLIFAKIYAAKVTVCKGSMRCQLYIRVAKKRMEFFSPKTSLTSYGWKKQQTALELTSPIRGTVDRTKAELERINNYTIRDRLISFSDTKKERPQGKRFSKKKETKKKRKYLFEKLSYSKIKNYHSKNE